MYNYQLCNAFEWYNMGYPTLLSNCSEYRPNNSTNIPRYCSVICTVENLFAAQVGARMQNCHTPCLFIDKFIDYSSWIINLLLDVLVYRIVLYFYSLFVFWLALRACQNTAQLVKIYSDTTTPKHLIRYIYPRTMEVWVKYRGVYDGVLVFW